MAESPYLLRFIQLPVGIHEFSYTIDGNFFRERENSIIQNAVIQVDVVLHKANTAMQLELSITGEVDVECVRCLESFSMPIDIEKQLVVRMVDHPENEDDDDDAIYIAKSAHEIELSNTLYDFISLEVPYSPVHPQTEEGEDGCDPEVLRHLQQPAPPASDEKPAEGDDRWAALRKIKLN
ncbi:MAG: DUF177 domain-containing protein [Bacteroidia bacterium]